MKRKAGIIGILLVLLIGVSGCSSEADKETGKKEPVSEEQIKNKSELQQLTLDEAFKKIEQKDTFIFMVTQSTCSYCNSFKKTLIPFLREHKSIPFYEIEVDMLGSMKADIDKNLERLQKEVPEFSGSTPEMFFYENGILKKSSSGEMSEIALTNFMIDCGFIKGKKQIEEAVDYTFKNSNKIKFYNIVDIAEKIKKKETFYLMITESDRYNQAFIETLIPILEKEDITIIGLQFPLEQQGSDDEMNTAYETLMNCIKDLSISPAVFEVKAGSANKLLEDNVSKEVIDKAFSKK